MSETKQLFKELESINFPEGLMVKPDRQVSGIAFFPVGRGLIKEKDTTISNKQVMILGQDFDTENNMKKVYEAGEEDIKRNSTWRNLLEFLKDVGIDSETCFFTNAFPAARANGNGEEKKQKNTGRSPAFDSKEFVKDCQNFFQKQIKNQKPKLVVVLGIQVAKFLSKFVEDKKWDSIKKFKDVDDVHA